MDGAGRGDDEPGTYPCLMSRDEKTCTFDIDSSFVELAVEVFALMADATRIQIILALRDHELPVNALAEIVGKAPATVSQHLAKLRLGHMVKTRRQGTQMFYSLTDEHARRLITEAVFQTEHALSDRPLHHAGVMDPERLRSEADKELTKTVGSE
ncbi:HTH-type transcriptional repressor CzrA [Propionibacterium australiense]|uniref:HTH_ARSR n=2 Tax=Propionibacterium australiense TaxID=119981 RepID=A0A383S9H4_9ACTN|nr:HTH_ARSR [Propionibacterium australiense]VEH90011.1 HTH-type transcriptional repressor CzrA [Propionibacterium australiense]